MEYEINVAERLDNNGYFGPNYRHLFTTKPLRTVQSEAEWVYAEIVKRFPAPDFKVTLTRWENTGNELRESAKVVREAWPEAYEAIRGMLVDCNGLPPELFSKNAVVTEEHFPDFQALQECAEALKVRSVPCDSGEGYVNALFVFIDGEDTQMQELVRWCDDNLSGWEGTAAHKLLNDIFQGELNNLFTV